MRVLFSKRLVALSKPRCGSTSLRRMLDPMMNSDAGDFAVDEAGQCPPFHPHITAAFLKKLLRQAGHDDDRLKFIITVRHPQEMLWSYYKFFTPDKQGKYRFMPGWDATTQMPFEKWIMEGQLPINPEWLALAPNWISSNNLSPLSLEFRAMDRCGNMLVDKIFLIEEPEKLAHWLECYTDRKVKILHTNRSSKDNCPLIGRNALDRIRDIMPYESELYGL